MQFSLQCYINSFCCFQAVPLPSPLFLLLGCLTRELLAGQFRGFYCNQERFSALAAGERTERWLFIFWGSAEDGEKSAGFVCPTPMGFGGCSCPRLCRDPRSGTAPGLGTSPLRDPTMLPKRCWSQFQGGNTDRDGSSLASPTQQAAFKSRAISTGQIYLDSTERLWCLLIPHLEFFLILEPCTAPADAGEPPRWDALGGAGDAEAHRGDSPAFTSSLSKGSEQ